MKVAYVLCQGEGGIPHYTAELANAVAENEDVHILKPPGTTADEFFEDVTIHEPFDAMNVSVPKIVKNEVDIGQILRALWSYSNVDYIHDIDPDVVHLTASSELFPFMKYFLWRVGIDESYPLIETFHTVDPNRLLLRSGDIDDVDNANLLKWLAINNAKNLASKALPTPNRSHAVVHTRKHKQRLVSRGVPPERISIIPHGAFELFHRDDDQPTEANTILFFGNIVSSKGPDTLVKAVPFIREQVPDVRVIFAGDGRFSAEAQETIERYDEHFEIHNRFVPNEEVGQLFSRAEVVSIPHRKLDAQSGALTIAYSFGNPVVTTTVGEPAGLIQETGAGLVIPPDDPEALATALTTVLQNDDLREVMSKNTETMRKRLSWSNIASEHRSIYREMADLSTEPPVNRSVAETD